MVPELLLPWALEDKAAAMTGGGLVPDVQTAGLLLELRALYVRAEEVKASQEALKSWPACIRKDLLAKPSGAECLVKAVGSDLVEEGRRLIVARECERDLMALAPLLLLQLHRLSIHRYRLHTLGPEGRPRIMPDVGLQAALHIRHKLVPFLRWDVEPRDVLELLERQEVHARQEVEHVLVDGPYDVLGASAACGAVQLPDVLPGLFVILQHGIAELFFAIRTHRRRLGRTLPKTGGPAPRGPPQGHYCERPRDEGPQSEVSAFKASTLVCRCRYARAGECAYVFESACTSAHVFRDMRVSVHAEACA